MPHLVRPDARYHRSYLAAADEPDPLSRDGHRHGDGDWEAAPDGDFAGYRFTRESLEDPAEFRRLVAVRRAEELEETPRPQGYVPCTFLWLVDGEEYLGSLALRHRLTPFLLEQGGHIGYLVRPSARGRGYAGVAVRQALELAGELGLERVLLTCDEDNGPSRAVIERAGGVYEDSREGRRRYWLPTLPATQPVGVRPVSGP